MEANPSAFSRDRSRQAAGAAVKAAWWGATGLALRAIAKPASPEIPVPASDAEPLPKGFFRQSWWEAISKDNADVAAGLYPPMNDGPGDPVRAVRSAIDMLSDAPHVEARRLRRGGTEAREDAANDRLPVYYRQNFHFQSGGWFTDGKRPALRGPGRDPFRRRGRADASPRPLFAGEALARARSP